MKKSATVIDPTKTIWATVLIVIGLIFSAIILSSLRNTQDIRSRAATSDPAASTCKQSYVWVGTVCNVKTCCPATAVTCKMTVAQKVVKCSCSATGCFRNECCGTNCKSIKVASCN